MGLFLNQVSDAQHLIFDLQTIQVDTIKYFRFPVYLSYFFAANVDSLKIYHSC